MRLVTHGRGVVALPRDALQADDGTSLDEREENYDPKGNAFYAERRIAQDLRRLSAQLG